MQITDEMVEAACFAYRNANTCHQAEAMRAALEVALGWNHILDNEGLIELNP